MTETNCAGVSAISFQRSNSSITMNLPTDNNEASPKTMQDYEALQQQRLAYQVNAAALQRIQSAGLNGPAFNQSRIHPLSAYGLSTIPTLPSDILNQIRSSINAQQCLLGSTDLPDIARLQMLGAGLGFQQSPSASSVWAGFHPMSSLPANAYQLPLVQRSEQQFASKPSEKPQKNTGPAVEASASHTSLDIPSAKSQLVEIDKGTLPRVVFTECDEKNLSEYQCLLRQQIEFYESSQLDMKWSIQGRNKAVVENQVGLRCKWCSLIPLHRRAPGAVYYSGSLDGLYQAAQNMAKNHFCKDCKRIPTSIKKHLTRLRDSRRRAPGGKRYWAEGARAIGIYECNGGLRFKKIVCAAASAGDNDEP